MRFTLPAVLLLTLPLIAQQTVVTCPTGSVPTASVVGQAATVVCTPVTPPPVTTAPTITALTADPSQIAPGASSTLRWTLGGGAPTSLSLNQGIGGVPVTSTSRVVSPTATTIYTLTASNSAGSVQRSATVTVSQPVTNIWPARVTDLQILGQQNAAGQALPNGCSATTHDLTLQDGGDNFRYYTWHAQTDPSGCIYGHEHGPDPAPRVQAVLAEITRLEAVYGSANANVARAAASAPLLFGKVARLMPMPGEPNGHVEPHEGFKVFYTTRGELNDEGRRSRITSVFLTHVGSGGVGRFTMPHHSVVARQVHEAGPLDLTQTMKNFGTANTVCSPRVSPTRDFIAILTSPCQIDSPYEIWQGHSDIGSYATTIATPAVFDPITVMNRTTPSELVYAWDPRVLVTRRFDGDSWAGFRGCDRESYAQMPVTHVAGFVDVWTDASGAGVLPPGTVNALRQVVFSPQTGPPLPGSDDGNVAFKVRRGDMCGNRARLGLKN